VQDYNFENTQYEIINLFVEKKVPITLGIIGNRIGENTKLTDLIKENLNQNLEVASHGWNHEKFSEFSLEEQINLMRFSSEKIFEVFDMKPIVFIAPFHRFNNNTIFAAQEIGITHFSAAIEPQIYPNYPLQNLTFYKFPFTAMTSEYDMDYKEGLSYGRPHEITFLEIEQSLSKLGFAVVMLHPYEYAEIRNGESIDELNKKQIEELELLITKIQEENLTIVPITKINLDSNVQN